MDHLCQTKAIPHNPEKKIKQWTSWPAKWQSNLWSFQKSPPCPLSHSARQLLPLTHIYEALFVNETDLHLNPHNISQCQRNPCITVVPVASRASPFYFETRCQGSRLNCLLPSNYSQSYSVLSPRAPWREATHFCSAVKRCYRCMSVGDRVL